MKVLITGIVGSYLAGLHSLIPRDFIRPGIMDVLSNTVGVHVKTDR